MAAASSSGDADAGDRLKGSATSGVTGLRAAADEAATAAAAREQAAAPGSQPTTPATSPHRPRRSRAVSASRPAGRGGRGGGRAAGDGRWVTQRQRQCGSRRAAPDAANDAGDRCATTAAASSLSRRAPYRRRPPLPRPPAPALPLRRPPLPLHPLPWMTPAAYSLSLSQLLFLRALRGQRLGHRR
uniref:Uncharacterized protein n=1 Tax=Oryza meridionalis TaxID=40149 RepID=A0A0E0F3A9_9ORYZ